eukprot:s620_g6.t1
MDADPKSPAALDRKDQDAPAPPPSPATTTLATPTQHTAAAPVPVLPGQCRCIVCMKIYSLEDFTITKIKGKKTKTFYKNHCPSCSCELRQIITASREPGEESDADDDEECEGESERASASKTPQQKSSVGEAGVGDAAASEQGVQSNPDHGQEGGRLKFGKCL